MTSKEGISRELSLGEVISRTFLLYRRDFLKYFAVFMVVDAIVGAVFALAVLGVHLASLPSNPTPEQIASWWSSMVGVFAYLALGTILAVALGAWADVVVARFQRILLELRRQAASTALTGLFRDVQS